MYLIPRFLRNYGLTVFILDGIKAGIVIDAGAVRHILSQTNDLRQLSVRHTAKVESSSLGKLVAVLRDLISSKPPRLTDLDFCGVGGSAEECDQLLGALYDSELQVKKIDISENSEWTQSENYSQMLCGALACQENLETINIS